MMKYLIVFLVIFAISWVQAQEVDTRYLEDQFYVGITYNLLLNKPSDVAQRNLSYGIQGGIIKDIPLNSRRNVGLGIGLGYALNSYYTNLQAQEQSGDIEYSVLDASTSFKRNKIETHLIEMPLEFRWRTSTATTYKFWRLYTGVKLGYIVGSRSKYVSDDEKISFYNRETQNFRYGLMLNFGYNTFNIHIYYGLNTLFEEDVATLDGDQVEFTPLKIGLIFYIL